MSGLSVEALLRRRNYFLKHPLITIFVQNRKETWRPKLKSKSFQSHIIRKINDSIKSAKFPAQFKCAEISPLYKAAHPLIENNFRQVGVLSSVSKVNKRVHYDQMYEYFMGILSSYLSTFRKKYGCHHVLIKLKRWKCWLHSHGSEQGIWLPPSQITFDQIACLWCIKRIMWTDHTLSYGKATMCYNRNCKKWLVWTKEMGPSRVHSWAIALQCFHKWFILFSWAFVYLYNYADDNSISHSHQGMTELKLRLEISADVAVDWFRNNNIQANTSKS